MSEESKLALFQARSQELSRVAREAEQFRKEAIQELLQELRSIDKQLVEINGKEDLQPKHRKSSNPICSICGGLPGHDARKHRGQEEKKPFTEEELKEKSLPGWPEAQRSDNGQKPSEERKRRRRPRAQA